MKVVFHEEVVPSSRRSRRTSAPPDVAGAGLVVAARPLGFVGRDVAAVLMETIPATYGFPVPSDGYLPGVARLCRETGSLYVADEVQTRLGRTGHLWGIEAWGVEPDMLVTGKGLSGGLYPVSAVAMTKSVGAWLGRTPGTPTLRQAKLAGSEDSTCAGLPASPACPGSRSRFGARTGRARDGQD